MTKETPPTREDRPNTREERWAAQLRENLHRRKAQARALNVSESEQTPGNGGLPKTPPAR